MRLCGFCKWLKEGVCIKGYVIIPLQKTNGYKRPKQCNKKQESATKRKQSSDSWINKQLDKLWSQKVRERGYCEYCGKKPPDVVLHAHHIFSRRHFSTRWLVDNGICLCTKCHLYIAHKDIQEFSDWVRVHYGDEKIDSLRSLSLKDALFSKYDKLEMIDRLKR